MKAIPSVVALVVIASIATAQDPVAVLKSGARLSGPIASVDRDGALILDQERAVRVRWDELASMRSENAVTIALASGDRVSLKINAVADGQIEGSHETFGTIRVPIASLVAAESAPAGPPVTEPAPAPAPEAPKDAPCCPKTPLDPKPLKGKVAFSATGRSGNVDSVLMALHAEATKDYSEDKLTAAIDALYGTTDEELTAASLGGRTRWDHFFSECFFSYVSAEALYDDVQNLDLRAILGIGVGDVLWKCNDDRLWSIEGGISALYEDYSTRDDVELSPAGRLGTVYKEILFEDLKFEETLEILVPLDDFAGYLVRSRTTLGVPLCQDLALRLSVEITYDGDPPAGTEALDILGLVGVEYQF